jgi:multiple sugar transport system substrate-binding protein
MRALRRLSRREFLRLAGLASAGAVLAGCDTLNLAPAARMAQKTQLVYQDWNTTWFPSMAQQQIDLFQTAHPDIQVFYIPDPTNLVDQMPLDMQAGTAADLFQGCCSHFPAWAQQGYTLDLRPYVAADLGAETIADWDPAQYKALFARDGRQYGLPKYHGALALYYNKDLFDRYRVDYPDGSWDHDDYLAAMKQVTHIFPGRPEVSTWGSMVDVSWDRLQVHVNGWGGHFVDPSDPRRSRMGDREALAAIEWLRARIWDDRVMATTIDVDHLSTNQAFVEERVVMVEDGSWALKNILANARFRVGVAPFPAGPARKVTLATTDGFGIYAGTRHPQAAWELMQFLISKEYGRAMAQANFLQPARISLLQDWIAAIRAQYPQQTREMDLAAFADGQINGSSATTEVFDRMAEASQIAQEAWDQILTLGQAPTESLIAASQRIEAVQAQAPA